MRALHLPGVPSGDDPPYNFPDKPAPPSALQYTANDHPEPQPGTPASTATSYIVRVTTTALTRGELTWAEVLDRSRFHAYGGPIPGHDVVGVIEEILPTGSREAKFKLGDQVWGLVDFDRDGAAADLVHAFEDELGLTPPSMYGLSQQAWNEALATLPLSGLTAWQGLFEHGGLPSLSPKPGPHSVTPGTEGKRVLITGAAGSVGVAAVQIAKAAGFHVTAVCSSRNAGFVRDELHAHEIIDHTEAGFESVPATMKRRSIPAVDVVFDCVGGNTLEAVILGQDCVKSGGRIVTIAGPISGLVTDVTSVDVGVSAAPAGDKRLKETAVQKTFFIVKPSGAQMTRISELVGEGHLIGLVDSVFDLEHGREAMEKVETHGQVTRGKVVLRV